MWMEAKDRTDRRSIDLEIRACYLTSRKFGTNQISVEMLRHGSAARVSA